MAGLVSNVLFMSGTTFVALGWAISLVLLAWLPYMAWSATRNIRQIRIQLERLNDTLEGKMTITKSGPLGL